MCQTKDVAVRDWIKLGIKRARLTDTPAIFWLDKDRSHDRNLIKSVEAYLKEEDTSELTIKILAPKEAISYTLKRVELGEDTISITGNVLRDYLTDLFPILELGTSAKMLSIVPLLEGGGLYETGAGGSAPKHVQQLIEENHLRWDSLGEFLALAVALEDIGEKENNKKAKVFANTLNYANTQYLKENRAPSRKVGELDNRGSHFYLAYYWSQALSEQKDDLGLSEKFSDIFEKLKENKAKILDELQSIQGSPVDLGGYYSPDKEKMTQVMRPSSIFNSIIDSLKEV